MGTGKNVKNNNNNSKLEPMSSDPGYAQQIKTKYFKKDN